MADIAKVKAMVRDPEFQALPWNERHTLLVKKDPEYAALSRGDQAGVMNSLKSRDFWQPAGRAVTGSPDASPAKTEQMRREFVAQEGTAGTQLRDIGRNALAGAKSLLPTRKGLANLVRPALEGGGAAGGAILGAAAGAPTVVGAPVGGVAGAATGYATGKYIADAIEGAPQGAEQTLRDMGTGAMFEMGGASIAPAVGMAAKGIGAVAKPVLGRLSGTGTGAVNEALLSGMRPTKGINPLKSTTTYDKALRGKISGEEIVDSARTALNRLKDARTGTYQGHLQQIASQSQPIDLRPVKGEVVSLMQKYNVKIDPATGALDTSRIAMGKTGRNDIKDIIEVVSSWGSKPGDSTALGLDTLKRQLDDFYSDSSQARQFVAQIRNKVKDTIVINVPQYDEMTKGYTEATKIIKDVEAGLMLRKQGMSGRIVADQTLRRLMSSMKDNFALRKELVDVLGKEGGEDLGAAIAGYAHSSVLPVGLAGTGPALIGSAALTRLVDPSFGALLAASSPRIQGEFLRMWGKGMKGAIIARPYVKPAAVQGAILATSTANQPEGATP